jgi:hypothetical protein
MVEISLSGSGEGLGGVIPRSYSTSTDLASGSSSGTGISGARGSGGPAARGGSRWAALPRAPNGGAADDGASK